jgi:hypothetical protein
MNIQAKNTVGFGTAHFPVLPVCFLTSFIFGIERFDRGDTNEGAVEYVVVSLINILIAPGVHIWTP